MAKLRSVLRTALAAHGILRGSVSVLITDDASLRDLNHRFRGLDESTDVLTFPAGDMPGPAVRPLGDIVISSETALRQAGMRGISREEEILVLALHGALHLAGFDDEKPDDRALMQAEMHRLADRLGLPGDAEWTSLAYGGAR
jgi:rRNA maturation RNase YbeY